MHKRSRTTFAVAGGLVALGLAVGAVFTVISGRRHAAAVAQGLDPGAARSSRSICRSGPGAPQRAPAQGARPTPARSRR